MHRNTYNLSIAVLVNIGDSQILDVFHYVVSFYSLQNLGQNISKSLLINVYAYWYTERVAATFSIAEFDDDKLCI